MSVYLLFLKNKTKLKLTNRKSHHKNKHRKLGILRVLKSILFGVTNSIHRVNIYWEPILLPTCQTQEVGREGTCMVPEFKYLKIQRGERKHGKKNSSHLILSSHSITDTESNIGFFVSHKHLQKIVLASFKNRKTEAQKVYILLLKVTQLESNGTRFVYRPAQLQAHACQAVPEVNDYLFGDIA